MLRLAFLTLLAAAAAAAAEVPEEAALSAVATDDECSSVDEGTGECSLSALQLRGVKVAGAVEAPANEAAPAEAGKLTGTTTLLVNSDKADEPALAQTGEGEREDWSLWGKKNPIDEFNGQLDSILFQSGDGLYYEFATAMGEKVWAGQVEGRNVYADAESVFPLASASKLFTAFAAMRTMQLKPKDWYPEKYVNEFKGWEKFSNFNVELQDAKANLTVHELLTHTSGLPFSMRASLEDIEKMTLFYKPGTKFGYTLGHRIIGWALRDYWKDQPETKGKDIKTVEDTFKFLVFEPMGLSDKTTFSDTLEHAFGYAGDAGDASIMSTGADMIKLAVVALRKGSTPAGKVLISETNWNKWAVPNLLPGGKLSKDLVGWEGSSASWKNFNVGGIKEQIMKQSGDYGWNYFGATYDGSKEIGWCGFFSSCLRVTYDHDLSFVMMQRDVADLKKSKPYLLKHFAEMAEFLQCEGSKGQCVKNGQPSIFCFNDGKVQKWSKGCPILSERGGGWNDDTKVDATYRTCYKPPCSGYLSGR